MTSCAERPAPLPYRVIARVSEGSSVVAGIVIVVLMLHVAANVILRLAADQQMTSTIEITSQWWMPLALYTALASTEENSEHIQVTILSDALPAKTRRTAVRTAKLTSFLAVAVLTYASARSAAASFEIREVTFGVAEVPVWPVKALVMVGLVVWGLQILADLMKVHARTDGTQ